MSDSYLLYLADKNMLNLLRLVVIKISGHRIKKNKGKAENRRNKSRRQS